MLSVPPFGPKPHYAFFGNGCSDCRKFYSTITVRPAGLRWWKTREGPLHKGFMTVPSMSPDLAGNLSYYTWNEGFILKKYTYG